MSEIINVGDIVRYQNGREDGLLPHDMIGEVKEICNTAQGTRRVRVFTTSSSALIEEFRLTKVQKIFG